MKWYVILEILEKKDARSFICLSMSYIRFHYRHGEAILENLTKRKNGTENG